ncbi:MAG: transposase [Polyangiaceae bacterium]
MVGPLLTPGYVATIRPGPTTSSSGRVEDAQDRVRRLLRYVETSTAGRARRRGSSPVWVRSGGQAARILTAITDDFARSELPEIRTLRSTLLRWRREVLAYFQTRLTNGMTEGFNLKAKLVINDGPTATEASETIDSDS